MNTVLLNSKVGSEKKLGMVQYVLAIYTCVSIGICVKIYNIRGLSNVSIFIGMGVMNFSQKLETNCDNPIGPRKKSRPPYQTKKKIVTPLFAANMRHPICNYASFSIFIFPNNILYS